MEISTTARHSLIRGNKAAFMAENRGLKVVQSDKSRCRITEVKYLHPKHLRSREEKSTRRFFLPKVSLISILQKFSYKLPGLPGSS